MILTLFGYIPPERFDSIPWTSARIQQSSTEDGSYTLVEEIALNPVDVDPANPLARSFTTELATAGDFYRLIWVDGDGTLSNPTQPVQLVDDPSEFYGTTAELQKLIVVNNPSDLQTAQMERLLTVATGEVLNEVGRTDLASWEVALATEVTLERAAEHWSQLKNPFGFVGIGVDTPFIAARDSWDRHAFKLAPLKGSWGIA